MYNTLPGLLSAICMHQRLRSHTVAVPGLRGYVTARLLSSSWYACLLLPTWGFGDVYMRVCSHQHARAHTHTHTHTQTHARAHVALGLGRSAVARPIGAHLLQECPCAADSTHCPPTSIWCTTYVCAPHTCPPHTHTHDTRICVFILVRVSIRGDGLHFSYAYIVNTLMCARTGIFVAFILRTAHPCSWHTGAARMRVILSNWTVRTLMLAW